jgi:3-oxoacyl-[acyl-carrier-protein] synthase-3
MTEATLEAVARAGLTLADIDLFVYHQANARITRAVGERLDLPPARVVDCIERLGNSSAATLPLALSVAEGDGRLRPGARVLLAAFGAGFTWGGGVIEWGSGGG